MNKFFKDRIAELHAVTWPTQRQASSAMATVLVVMLLVGFGLGLADFVLSELVLSLLK